ncbi:hypothetical protein HC891_15385, partial [Candidatus Gracilibacteria bacterium]|nr:hypothetical protein [Candidatus Gracilibacteria bacterium]
RAEQLVAALAPSERATLRAQLSADDAGMAADLAQAVRDVFAYTTALGAWGRLPANCPGTSIVPVAA